MASYLSTVSIGRLRAYNAVGPHGLPISNYSFQPLTSVQAVSLRRTENAIISFLENLVGSYPFNVYGAMFSPALNGFGSLENQTRPTYRLDLLHAPGGIGGEEAGGGDCPRVRASMVRRQR